MNTDITSSSTEGILQRTRDCLSALKLPFTFFQSDAQSDAKSDVLSQCDAQSDARSDVASQSDAQSDALSEVKFFQ